MKKILIELSSLSFGSIILLCAVWISGTLLADYLTDYLIPKISCWIQNRKEVSGDD